MGYGKYMKSKANGVFCCNHIIGGIKYEIIFGSALL